MNHRSQGLLQPLIKNTDIIRDNVIQFYYYILPLLGQVYFYLKTVAEALIEPKNNRQDIDFWLMKDVECRFSQLDKKRNCIMKWAQGSQV